MEPVPWILRGVYPEKRRDQNDSHDTAVYEVLMPNRLSVWNQVLGVGYA